MPPPKTILKFSGLLLLLWVLLLAPWPGVESAYASFFRGLGNVAFSRFWFWGDASVRFCDARNAEACDLPPWAKAQAPPPLQERDTVMALENRQVPGSVSFLRTSSRLIGYWPTAGLVGLILATPARWRRKLLALGLGLLLVHAFILLRLTVHLAIDGFSGDKAVAIFHPGPSAARVMAYARTILNDDPVVSFVAPVVIWVALLFRPSQWVSEGNKNELERVASV